jgi:signal transduction histidine kinase
LTRADDGELADGGGGWRRSPTIALRDAALILLPLAVLEGLGRAGYGMRDPRPVLLTVVACAAASGGLAATFAAVALTAAYGVYYEVAGVAARTPFGPAFRATLYVGCAAVTAFVVYGLSLRARRQSEVALSARVERERRVGAMRVAVGEELHRTVLASLPAHIAVLDAAGNILTTNAAWDRFAEENGAAAAGAGCGVGSNYLRVCRGATGPEARPAAEVADGIEAVLRGSAPAFQIEYPCHAPDRQRWFLLLVTPLSGTRGASGGSSANDGDGAPGAANSVRPGGAVICHFDITDRKLSEEAMTRRAAELAAMARRLEKTNAELDQFAYITSHDLRAPLRGIANLSRWIEEDLGDSFPPEAHKQMELLRGRVNRMEAMIDGILEYSRVGRVRQKVEEVDVASLLAEVIDLLDVPASFTVDVAAGMPVISAEQLPLQQVFMNLIGNAIKHHDKPSGTVRVSCTDVPQDDRSSSPPMIEFVVADDGPGIEPQYHEKVFMIFQTLEARDKVEGTGVGLSLVRKIVETQGGSIRLEAAKGNGSTFRFTWPWQALSRPSEGDGRAETTRADRPRVRRLELDARRDGGREAGAV